MLRQFFSVGRTAAVTVLVVQAVFYLAWNAHVCAQEPPAGQQVANWPAIEAMLDENCYGCHGDGESEGGLDLQGLSRDLQHNHPAGQTWLRVRRAIELNQMPPDEAWSSTDPARVKLIEQLSQAIQTAAAKQRATSRSASWRVMNRSEYQATMTALLGIEIDYCRDLPPDALAPDGFLKDASHQQITAVHLEQYLAAARRGLKRILLTGPPPEVFEYYFRESNVTRWLPDPERSNRLGRRQAFLVTMVKDYPEFGDFEVGVRVRAELKERSGWPLLEVSVGYRPDTQILFRSFAPIEIQTDGTHEFTFKGRIEDFPLPVRGQGKFPGLVVRVRNIYDDGSPLPKAEKAKGAVTYPREPNLPELIVESVSFRGPSFTQWPTRSYRDILFDSPLRESEPRRYVGAVLKRFCERAFRRPVKKQELQRFEEFFWSIREQFPTLEAAVIETLAFVLIQPQFLCVSMPNHQGDFDTHALASKLSFFLWNQPPDESLTLLATSGALKEPAVLREQVDRLLSDQRSRGFIESFATQWLQLDQLDAIAVDGRRFPKFDDRMKEEFQEQAVTLLGHVIRENRSALELLRAPYVLVNEPLSRHYGIAGVVGQAMRPVDLEAGSVRGGLLGQSAFLLANSTGSEPHAIRRAVWIRDRLLGDPPLPPPPDVPTLEQLDPDFHKRPIREQLAIHRNSEACASCHADLDPWGLALEHMDALGLEQPVESGEPNQLPGGVELGSLQELRDYLADQCQPEFTEALTRRLLRYALARPLELRDEQEVMRLMAKFEANGFRVRDLLVELVVSPSFMTE